mgnify:CR=1 FL=1
MRKYSRSNAHQGLRDRLANVASDYRADLKSDSFRLLDAERAAWYAGYMSAVIGAIKNELENSYSNGRDHEMAAKDYIQAQLVKVRLVERGYAHLRKKPQPMTTPFIEEES